MIRVKLTRGYIATLDDEDEHLIEGYSWHALVINDSNLVYAVAKNTKTNGPRSILMHRLIMDAPKRMTVDHIDRNGLNNTRKNLRFATRWEQQANRKKNNNNTSGFKGVWKTKRGPYRAEMRLDNAKFSLGTYDKARDAALVYNVISYLFKGDYASLNDIEGQHIGMGRMSRKVK